MTPGGTEASASVTICAVIVTSVLPFAGDSSNQGTNTIGSMVGVKVGRFSAER